MTHSLPRRHRGRVLFDVRSKGYFLIRGVGFRVVWTLDRASRSAKGAFRVDAYIVVLAIDTLRPAHRRWLAGFAAGQGRAGQYIWVRGMASRLGNAAANRTLSARRARSVRNFLVDQCRVPVNRVTGIVGVGESWARGSETDNSARWRAAEVIITNRVVDLPGSSIHGATPISSQFWIKYMGSGSGGEGGAGEVALFIVRTPTNYWQRYMYIGGGVGGGAPISWGEALPPGQGWVRFSARGLVSVAAFDGWGSVNQASAQVGPVGVGLFSLKLENVREWIVLRTGSGFSLGASATGGRMIAAGEIEHSGGWEYY